MTTKTILKTKLNQKHPINNHEFKYVILKLFINQLINKTPNKLVSPSIIKSTPRDNRAKIANAANRRRQYQINTKKNHNYINRTLTKTNSNTYNSKKKYRKQSLKSSLAANKRRQIIQSKTQPILYGGSLTKSGKSGKSRKSKVTSSVNSAGNALGETGSTGSEEEEEDDEEIESLLLTIKINNIIHEDKIMKEAENKDIKNHNKILKTIEETKRKTLKFLKKSINNSLKVKNRFCDLTHNPIRYENITNFEFNNMTTNEKEEYLTASCITYNDYIDSLNYISLLDDINEININILFFNEFNFINTINEFLNLKLDININEIKDIYYPINSQTYNTLCNDEQINIFIKIIEKNNKCYKNLIVYRLIILLLIKFNIGIFITISILNLINNSI